MIIEDDADLADLEATVLAGHDVTLVTTGFEGLFSPDRWDGVDVAVVDLMLPGVNGEDIIDYLAQAHPTVRRVVCTAKPISELGDMWDRAHVVLLKPFGVADLQKAVAP